MPAADTVWPKPIAEMHMLLAPACHSISWEEDWSESHCEVAAALSEAYAAGSGAIASQIGRRVQDELLAVNRLWSEWLATGRPQLRPPGGAPTDNGSTALPPP